MFIKYNDLDSYFEEIYDNLDIPESFYEKADISYKSFGRWLGRENSTVKKYEPSVFLQGSFKLGTVIKPISDNIHYDIDLVCKLKNVDKSAITQKDLKEIIGKEVLDYSISKNMSNEPKNGKRCWTLNYHDEAQFHMDILPCINDYSHFTEKLRLNYLDTDHKDHIIAITDQTSNVYEVKSLEWEISNPHGYYLWFKNKMKFQIKKSMLAESSKINIEEIPDYKVKTQLQKAIQILKRHRDYTFIEDLENKPSSIIITTLSALIYEGEDNLKDIIKNIVYNITNHIDIKNGEFYIPNPVNPLENFADRWNDDPNKKLKFDEWIKVLKEDFVYYKEKFPLYGENFLERTSDIFGLKHSKIINDENNKILLESISHRQHPKWKVSNNVFIKIKATKIKKGFSVPREFKSGEYLSKNVKLKFEAIANNIKKYDIYWQITNTGIEARNSNCLRGNFCSGEIEEGKKIRKESAMYAGSHLVECYLVKDNICVGKSEAFIVNINDVSNYN